MRRTHSIALPLVLGALLACKAKAQQPPAEPPKTEPVNTEPAKTDAAPTQPAAPATAEADPSKPQGTGATQPTTPLIQSTPHPQGFRPVKFVLQPIIKPQSMGGSGLPRAKTLRDLTTADTAKLCDWYADLTGGYGAVTTCEHRTNHAPKSRAMCQSELFPTNRCTVTVGEMEACLTQLWRSSCSSVNVFKIAACQPYLACAWSATKEGDRRK
jgi:hypothetical protein